MSDPRKMFPDGDGETQNSGRWDTDNPEPINPPNETDLEAEKDGFPDNPTDGETEAN